MVLHKKVLILNKNFVAIDICSVKRAIIILFKERAEIITSQNGVYDIYDWDRWTIKEPKPNEPFIKTSHKHICLPEVIRLCDYDRYPRQRLKYSKRAVFRRDNFQCVYCGESPGVNYLNRDHLIPRSQGGKTNFTNIVTSCFDCNSKKDNRTPEQAGMKFYNTNYKPTVPMFSLNNEKILDSWKIFLGKI